MDPKKDTQSAGSLTPQEIGSADVMLGDSKINTEIDTDSNSGQALRESEERLRLALEAGRMGTWEWRIRTNEVIWSPGLEAIHGIPTGSFPGTFDAYQDDMHPEDRERVLSCISKTLGDGIDHQIEYRLVLPDERIRWVEGRGRLFRDEEGNPERMIGVCVDITDRKESEEALQNIAAEMSETLRRENEFAQVITEQAERLRTTLSSIGDGVITTDNEGLIINLNPVAEGLTGWSTADAAGQTLDKVFSIVNETTRETVGNPAMKALHEGIIIVGLANHTILISKDGTETPIDDSAAPIRCKEGEIVGCVLVFRDITERKRIEKELSRSREDLERRVIERTAELTHANVFLNTLLENLREGIVACDGEGILTLFNNATREFHGLPEERLPAEKWADHYDLFHPDGITRMKSDDIPLYRALAGEVLRDVEMVIAPKNGEKRILLASGQAFHDDQGEVLGAVVSMHDITRRKQAEDALAAANDELEARVAGRTAELAASEQRATDIVTSIADGLITLDQEWRITYMNPRSEVILRPLQKTNASVRGQILWDEFPDAVGTEQEEQFRRAMHERVAIQYEVYSEPLGLWLDVRGYPSSSGLSIYFLDITERKRAEEGLRQSEERFRMLADSISQLAWTCEDFAEITWYNKRWLDYTGLTFEETKGWGWKQVHHPDHLDRVLAGVERARVTGEPWEDTFPLKGKDGNYRWFLSRAQPILANDGQIVQWFGTNTDVTAERQMADELRQLSASLSEGDRRKNEFLAMLAHELRNPLAPIRNALKIMKISGGGSTNLDSAADMMERQVGQLVRLVDDLLDVSRISRGKIELRRELVELDSIIHQAVEAARPSCDAGGVELHVFLPETPIYVDGDSARLNQTVGNLLNNACKFTEDGGRIDLTVTEEEGFAVIRVKDTGIGIDPSQLHNIFDLFVQADTSLERSASGLGIGLSLVKNLVQMHGGTVTACSEGLGRGSEFVIRIPVVKSHDETPASASRSEPKFSAAGKLRILVVDDNIDSAESLALLLQFSGHQTAVAHDGRQAVDMASSFEPEVMLLDIGLPKLNGYEAARAIRELPDGKLINLIALTGWGQQEDRDRSKEAGFDGHMVKPVDHTALMKQLDDIWKARNGSGH